MLPPTLPETRDFLRRRHALMRLDEPPLLFRDDRPKNVEALAALKLRRDERLGYILALGPEQACQRLLSDAGVAALLATAGPTLPSALRQKMGGQ